ncbi:unnamed protein product, partial [Rotaria sp. Silwood2]
MTDIFELNNNYYDMRPFTNNWKTSSVVLPKYQFNRFVDRNIVLLGRLRTGKSTLIKVLKSSSFRPTGESLYTHTQNVQFQNVTIESNDGIKLRFNIFDTPGHFQVTGNDCIKQIIDACIAYGIINVHMFAFVINLTNCLNYQDIEAIKFLKNKYPSLGKHMALILTHCESLTNARRQQLTDDFLDYIDVRRNELAEYFGQDSDSPTRPIGDAKSQWVFTANGNSFAYTRQYDEISAVAWTANLDIYTIDLTISGQSRSTIKTR